MAFKKFSVKQPVNILLADDDPDDQSITLEAFRESELPNHFYAVENGQELLDFLRHKGCYKNVKKSPRPSLLLLDINMPKMTGLEALQEIKQDDQLRTIPIIILTTSIADEDIIRSYNLGVNSYIKKPVNFEDLLEAVIKINTYWFDLVSLPPGAEN
ncbi:MAG: response regulator [Cyanobacteria bacterium P01_H01_bin.74]